MWKQMWPMTTLTKVLLTLCWVLLGAHVAMIAWAWPLMPDVLPSHFGVSGAPDSWGPKGFATLGVLPLTHGVLILLFTVLIPHPEWSNLPSTKRFIDFDHQAQRRIAWVLQGMLASIAGLTSLLLSTLSFSVIRIGLGSETSLHPVFLALPVALVVVVLLGILSLRWAMRTPPINSRGAGESLHPLRPGQQPGGIGDADDRRRGE